MPSTYTYPGVYIEEIPSGVHTIMGVATSIGAFVGRAERGDTNKAATVNSFGDFERMFGGLWPDSSLGFAVNDFFRNGGSQAVIVRLFHSDFANDNERTLAKAAADAVATAAKGAADVAGAKTAATTARDTIINDNTKTAVEKTAAKAVASAIAALAGNAKAADIAAAASAAVIAAVPYPNARLTLGNLKLKAANEGAWGSNLRARIDRENITDDALFNLNVTDTAPGGSSELLLNLSVDEFSPRRFDKVLESESKLTRVDGDWKTTIPDLADIKQKDAALKAARKANPQVPAAIAAAEDALWNLALDAAGIAESKYARAKKTLLDKQNAGGDPTAEKAACDTAKAALDLALQTAENSVSDGGVLTVLDFLPPNGEVDKKGLYALEQTDLFNLLCIPPYKAENESTDVDVNVISAAATYCEKRRAMLIVDAPKDWNDKTNAKEKFSDVSSDNVGTRSHNAAIFFPRINYRNPLRDNQMQVFAACGAIAGLCARTDTQRGVWKAPAGQDATLVGVAQLSVGLTDAENGELNPLGINCLRAFPFVGSVVWGSRTLRGADQLADEWKYLPVRRTALFIEESLYRGTKWVVFEPNDEPLWAQIRLNVGAFMHSLFRQGAFQGTAPRDAYFVKCDKETTTQDDINKGIVNIVVGFAPLKPAEFVVIKIQQMAGQIQS